ncbi:hypothetical protein EV421DRAFT_548676 [Armillaria borealis]|uniref:Uncharacterized protein n=1 Tax=Armillaria borealis TaxID=47425 RepID=A0AA39JHE9_9AGAR|nr:hypothetical protein EV421DRAFT_548676 [Armillaria borealis]
MFYLLWYVSFVCLSLLTRYYLPTARTFFGLPAQGFQGQTPWFSRHSFDQEDRVEESRVDINSELLQARFSQGRCFAMTSVSKGLYHRATTACGCALAKA